MLPTTIKSIRTRLIFNKFFLKLFEVDVILQSGHVGRSIIQQEIIPNADFLVGMNVLNTVEIDNSILQNASSGSFGLSVACARAASAHARTPMFVWMMGRESQSYNMPLLHIPVSRGIIDFCLLPEGFSSCKDSIIASSKVMHYLSVRLISKNKSNISNIAQSAARAIEQAGYELGKDFLFGLRVNVTSSDSQDVLPFLYEFAADFPVGSMQYDHQDIAPVSFGKHTQIVSSNVADDQEVLSFSSHEMLTITDAKSKILSFVALGKKVLIVNDHVDSDLGLSDFVVSLNSENIQVNFGKNNMAYYNQILRICEDLSPHSLMYSRFI